MKVKYSDNYIDGKIHSKEISSIDYCCETMRKDNGSGDIGINAYRSYFKVFSWGDWAESSELKFCPFCGEKIEYIKVGEKRGHRVKVKTEIVKKKVEWSDLDE